MSIPTSGLIPFFSTLFGALTAFALAQWKASRDRRNQQYGAILNVQVTLSRHIFSLQRIRDSEVFKDPSWRTGEAHYGHLNITDDGEHFTAGSVSFMLSYKDVKPEVLLQVSSADRAYWNFMQSIKDRNEAYKLVRESMKFKTPILGKDGKPTEEFKAVVDDIAAGNLAAVTKGVVDAMDHAYLTNKDAMRIFRIEAKKVFPKRRLLSHEEYSPSMRE